MNSHPRLMESPPGPYTVVDGRRYLYFVGTGYLGLQGREEVVAAACAAAHQYGLGSATSRAGFGTTPPAVAVERAAADWLASDDAFYLPSGYAAAGILLRAIRQQFDSIFIDEHAHYSLREAAIGTGLPLFPFPHAQTGGLRTALGEHLQPQQRPLVVSDGVFSARGTIAPARQYVGVLENYAGAGLMIDDAHGWGVLGDEGRGTLEHEGVWGIVNSDPADTRKSAGVRLFHAATLSKALGGYGGIITGPRVFVDRLKATSHWYDGASALPPPVAAATARAIAIARYEPQLRTRLWTNVTILKEGLRRLGLAVDATPSPIVCLTLDTAARMQSLQATLQEQGILIAYFPSYSGLGPQGGLRLAVFATHTPAMIEELIDALRVRL